MKRRSFFGVLGSGAMQRGLAAVDDGVTGILLPELPFSVPLPEAVLFGFDNRVFPFQDQLETQLRPGVGARTVLRHGPPGSHDEVLLFYGSVIRVGNTFHMWYTGNYGPLLNHIGYELRDCVLCYATSTDGVNWEKPNLGLVEFNGSKENNICDLAEPTLWSTAAVLHDPEDPNPDRRFKIAYEARFQGNNKFCVAFSRDGLRWQRSPKNPVGPFLEMAGVTKFRGRYYVSGQGDYGAHGRAHVRRLDTFVSDDFEYWSPCSALGLDRSRDLVGPSTLADAAQEEEVHLGAALWNRGNVILGIYGQLHGHFSGDRRFVVLDLGLALTHDGLHYHEPIPGFRLIPAREQPESARGVGPALMQGQGMENFGGKTLYWYGPWRGTENSGVRMVSWAQDRLGSLKPILPSHPRAISTPIRVTKGKAKLFVNASGLGQYTQLRIGLMTDGFRPIPAYSDADAAVIGEDSLRSPVRWKGGDILPNVSGPIRITVEFAGVRPEDAALHAIYVSAS